MLLVVLLSISFRFAAFVGQHTDCSNRTEHNNDQQGHRERVSGLGDRQLRRGGGSRCGGLHRCWGRCGSRSRCRGRFWRILMVRGSLIDHRDKTLIGSFPVCLFICAQIQTDRLVYQLDFELNRTCHLITGRRGIFRQGVDMLIFK